MCWKAETSLPTEVCIVKALVFPLVTYGCESWTVKKAECQKNWCLPTVVLEKTPESPLDSRDIQPVDLKGNQPWILVGRTDADAETLVFWSSDANSWPSKSSWCWERLRAEGEEGIRGSDGWMASPLQWTWTWVNSRRWWSTGRPSMLQSVGSQRVGHDWATEQQHSLHAQQTAV